LSENRSAPVISFNTLVYAGSAIETDAEAGMCHVIEHMIFKGTPTRPVGAIARDVEAAGGEVNAYTSFDQTVFYINMASRFAEKGLEIIADAVINPLFDADELEREIEVICEEIRRGKDNPGHCISEDLFKHAFTKHTYGRPVIGFYKTVKSFKRDDVLSFYRKHYRPDNITFIVVGNFDTKEMLAKIETNFSSFKRTDATVKIQTPIEPEQRSIKVNTNTMEIHAAQFLLGFHVPNIVHNDIPALDILSHILGGAESSRFEQIIKEKKRLVHTVYSYVYTPKDPGIMMIGGVTQSEKVVQTIDAVWEELKRISTETVSADELNRAKINIRASEVYERESVGGQGAKLAYFLATAGDYQFEKRYFQMLGDVTAGEVRMAAEKYLTPGNCTVEVLSPKHAKVSPTKSAIEAACTGSKNPVLIKKIERSKPKVHTLKNGVRLIIRENHTLPIVSVYAAVHGGLRYETPKINGISYLLSRSLTKGTKKRSAVEIAKKIESIAGIIDGYSGRNTIGIRTEFLSEKLHDGFGLFAEVLCDADFDDEEVTKEKAQQIESIHNQEDNLHSMAYLYFMRNLYGKHPYGLRTIGEKESVKRLNSRTLRRYWEEHLNPRDLCISVVGDVSPDEVREMANDWITLKRHKTPRPLNVPIKKPEKIIVSEVIKKGKEQAHVVMGFLGTIVSSPDHYKFSVLNHILSGQGGRLFVTLRDKMSLAYSVNSSVQSGLEPGYFTVYIGTDPSKLDTAIKGIKRELESLCKEPVSKEELERAQQYMVGTYELEQQRNSALAASYTFNELYGLGIAEVEKYPQRILKVTRKDILKTARKYIDLNAYVLSIIKPA